MLCIHRLPSPSTTSGRFCQFLTIFRFIPSSTDELVWLSGERICCCVRFSSPVRNSLKEREHCPELYTEFMHHSPTTQSVHLSWSQVQRCPDVAWSQPPKLKDLHTNHVSNRPQNFHSEQGEKQWHLLVEPRHGYFASAVVTSPGIFPLGLAAP